MLFAPLSAVFSGVAELRKVFAEARDRRVGGIGTLLFVDEIHRFNRAQQDAFLPVVEDGTVILVGATTENPSFELNGALLSRCAVLVLNRLDDSALETLLARTEEAEGRALPLSTDARPMLRAMADGDGRALINLAEALFAAGASTPLDVPQLMETVQRRAPLYDKSQEGHYNLISALHKSLRGSDTDAALYWLARMLAGGEDARYIARRLVRFAVEDVGLADPDALPQALAGWEAYERLGSPEGELAIAQTVIYLGTAAKSNASYRAFSHAMASARETGSLAPPKHILNAPTRLMKDLGYSKGYVYDHDTEEGFSGPELLSGRHGAAHLLRAVGARLRARGAGSASPIGRSCARPPMTVGTRRTTGEDRARHCSGRGTGFRRALLRHGRRRALARVAYRRRFPIRHADGERRGARSSSARWCRGSRSPSTPARWCSASSSWGFSAASPPSPPSPRTASPCWSGAMSAGRCSTSRSRSCSRSAASIAGSSWYAGCSDVSGVATLEIAPEDGAQRLDRWFQAALPSHRARAPGEIAAHRPDPRERQARPRRHAP